ncbi:hypothetical protein SEA_VINCENZO_98 [Mycobacterium phage Vincenzo]|uniref:Uncharacterized protein n=2 Tax=Coopervirus vincenzo TaxID=1983110 RepID=A0A0F6WDU4_9CAUD|nr:hypothetical protein SEA_VINCENZO_98 [Mycobacterium phage Vincenzo]AKF14360.1 hypothetical protein SEA_VINCENZO_98 [Mycobacterium phage Vincenzo]AKF14764.1 hypothetical protein SEA_ALANGRANT_99 [Mycobacterium phage AlanGrant]
MASITFTATAPNGQTFTRTSPTMPYTHVLMTSGSDGETWGPYSWHKSPQAAEKARSGKVGEYFAREGYESTVVEAVPTAVKGTAHVGDFPADKGWPEAAIDALILAKGAKPAKAAPVTEELAPAIAKGLDFLTEPAPKKSRKSVVGSAPREGNVPTEAERTAAIERELAAIDAAQAAKADAQAQRMNAKGRPATHRQLLGESVHALIYAALDSGKLELPVGMDEATGRETIRRWLQYVPTPENPAGLPTPRA